MKYMKKISLVIIVIVLFLITGCQKKTDLSKIPQDTGTTFLMDTLIQMKVYGENADDVIKESFARLREIENEMSVSITDSQISKVNNNPGKYVKIDRDTFLVIKKALEYAELTNGRFDPSIGPLVKLWGIGTKYVRVPADDEITQTRKKVNYKWVEINEEEYSVKVREGMMLDIGAIAKGYAADEVRKIVINNNVKSAYVNLGGNVLVVGGKPDSTPWRVGIQDPRYNRGNVMTSIDVRDKTIVTSGNYERYFEQDGIIYHHIIDPMSGRPSRSGIISVSIITNNSFDADALSTSVFILGPEKGLELVNKLKGVEVLIIKENLDIIMTDGLKSKVKLLNDDFKIVGK